MARILYLWYHQLDWDRNRLDKKEGGMGKKNEGNKDFVSTLATY